MTLYSVTSSNQPGVVFTGVSSPITVSGLTNGVAYYFSVTATNAYGVGPASANSATAVVNWHVNPGYTASGTFTTVSTVTNNWIRYFFTFTGPGTFQIIYNTMITTDILVVGGGGGGGGASVATSTESGGSGGGGGGVAYVNLVQLMSGVVYSIGVGTGGAGGDGPTNSSGASGSGSSFGSLLIGGGGGGGVKGNNIYTVVAGTSGIASNSTGITSNSGATVVVNEGGVGGRIISGSYTDGGEATSITDLSGGKTIATYYSGGGKSGKRKGQIAQSWNRNTSVLNGGGGNGGDAAAFKSTGGNGQNGLVTISLRPVITMVNYIYSSIPSMAMPPQQMEITIILSRRL